MKGCTKSLLRLGKKESTTSLKQLSHSATGSPLRGYVDTGRHHRAESDSELARLNPLNRCGFGLAQTLCYVYLSGGGHFENLGLYEMVLRRCGLNKKKGAHCGIGTISYS